MERKNCVCTLPEDPNRDFPRQDSLKNRKYVHVPVSVTVVQEAVKVRHNHRVRNKILRWRLR